MNTAQTHLYRKAGSATFLQSIGSEPIGLVLRDILLFQSQSYVLQQQAIEINREMLMAQVMTNALLVAHLRDYESTLYYKLRSA